MKIVDERDMWEREWLGKKVKKNPMVVEHDKIVLSR